jgi:predicted phosphoribosyltransferase
VNPAVILLVDDGIGPGGALGMQLYAVRRTQMVSVPL